MKLLPSILFLAHILTSNASAIDEVRVSQALTTAQERHRELQFLPPGFEQIFEVLDFITAVTEAALPGDAQCQSTFLPALGFACNYNSPACVRGRDSFCAQPTLDFGFNLIRSEIQFEFCTNTATDGGADVPGACFNFDISILDLMAGGLPFADMFKAIEPFTSLLFADPEIGADAVAEYAAEEVEEEKKNLRKGGKKGGVKEVKKGGDKEGKGDEQNKAAEEEYRKPEAIIKNVKVTMKGKECKSASPCNNGKGYVFDCSNFEGGMVQSSCKNTHFVVDFSGNDHEPFDFLPEPDRP